MTTGSLMRAWRTTGEGRIELGELSVPTPGEGEVLVRTEVCGVCRTDLHVVRGELARHRPHVVPGHELVGIVVAAEGDTGDVRVGDRVGVPWLRSTCGTCHWCSTGRENLCERSHYTGWDADGGMPSTPQRRRRTPIRSPTASIPSRPHRCCVPGSSGIAR
jgi:alcohol dehydrogenase, propanol-preferring